MKKNLYSILAFLFALLGFFSFISQTSAWSGETTNLEVYLNFNNSIDDSSIWGRDMVVASGSGGPIYVASTGTFQNALACNNSYVLTTTPGKYIPSLAPTTGFTISFWRKVTPYLQTLDFLGLGYPINDPARGDLDPIVYSTKSLLYLASTGGNYQGLYVDEPANGTWQHQVFIVSYTGNITYYFSNGSYFGSSAGTPLYYGDRITVCGHRKNNTPSELDFVFGTGYIDEFRYYSRVLTPAEVSALYTGGETIVAPTDEDGLCGYALGFTGSFATGDACLAGIFTGLTTFDVNGYTGYSYTCAGVGSGINDSCATAEQTTGYCGTMQSQTFYQDIEDYSSQYTYCSGGNHLMTGLSYLEGNYWDWYCNGPSLFGPQSYCSAYDFNQNVSVCGPSNLQTYTGDITLTGSNLCLVGEDGGLLFRENYGRIWHCAVENSLSTDASCVAYLSGGTGILTGDYFLDDPFDPVLYGNEDQLSSDALFYLGLLRSEFEFFDTLWTFFTTYFVFFPQETDTLTIYLPGIAGDHFGAFGIDAGNAETPFYASKSCDTTTCIYTMPLGNTIAIQNNFFIKFLRQFLPILFSLLYVATVLIFISVVLFLPIYILGPIFNRIQTLIFTGLNSASSNIVSFVSWFAFAIPFYALLFASFAYYSTVLSPFVDQLKATLGYIFTFLLKLLMIEGNLLRQSVIALNFAFWTILIGYLFYRASRYGAKL